MRHVINNGDMFSDIKESGNSLKSLVLLFYFSCAKPSISSIFWCMNSIIEHTKYWPSVTGKITPAKESRSDRPCVEERGSFKNQWSQSRTSGDCNICRSISLLSRKIFLIPLVPSGYDIASSRTGKIHPFYRTLNHLFRLGPSKNHGYVPHLLRFRFFSVVGKPARRSDLVASRLLLSLAGVSHVASG